MNDWKEIEACHQGEREARIAADKATDEATKIAHLKEADRYSARAWMLINRIKRPT